MQKEQFIHVDKNGTKRYYSDRKMTILHREDGPAVEGYDGSKWWWVNDKLHNENGPAVEWASGYKEWRLNGKLHREDGPAIEWADGSKAWYLNGEELTEDEFNVSVDKLKIKK